jgi:hypothetical protein
MLLVSLWLLLLVSGPGLPSLCAAISAPNVSLVTMPIAYFGGHHNQNTSAHGSIPCPAAGCRPVSNLQMLAKMRIVMVEKWEGHCYDGCMYNASKHMPCYPSCNVEGDMLRTLAQVKTINPSVKGVVYLNTLMAFPFYALSGRFADNNALLMDMYTKKPVELTVCGLHCRFALLRIILAVLPTLRFHCHYHRHGRR